MKNQNKKTKQKPAGTKEKVGQDGVRRKKLKPQPKEKYKKKNIDEEEE